MKPNFITDFLYKVLVVLNYKREEYLFYRSRKKYISSWGEGTYGLPRVISFDRRSTVSVGAYTSIAPEVSFLLGANHKRGLVTTFPIDRINPKKTTTDSNERADISIGSDVWIGYGATILGGVTVGDGAIIGAEALVVEDVPPYAVVGGVPAKVLKYRFTEDQIGKLLKITWWKWEKEKIQGAEGDIYSGDVESFIRKYL